MARLDYTGARVRHRGARRKSGWQGSMRLGALFTVLVGINVYVFFFRGGTSIHDLLKTSAAINKKPVALSPKGSSTARPVQRQPDKDDSLVLEGTLRGYIGLSSALAALKVDNTQVAELVASLRGKLDMRSLRPEHQFEVRLDPSSRQIRKFTYRLSPVSSVVAVRNAKGLFRVKRKEVPLETRVARVGGRINSSLLGAMSAAGERAALVSRFVDIFSWDVNWYSDPREGDEFRIIVEKKYKDGVFYRYGTIRAAEYRGKIGRFQAFYHNPKQGKPGYYTPEGRMITREFLKTPLNFRRISSKFNKRRFHPVLHQTKGHFGVDYAAARGTPVWAVAQGKVTRIGRFGGAGNMIRLEHAKGRTTIYMHLQGFAQGLKRGSKVRQRQVIGYVGSTGLATGAHLHYGILVDGRHVDPLKFNVGKGATLPRRERARFLDGLTRRMAALESIAVAPAERTASR